MSTKYVDQVKFEPWVGKDYATTQSIFNKKVLVLGGSHYGQPGEENPGFTRKIVELYKDEDHKDSWKSTYSKFINSVYLKEADWGEREQFLDSVVFYNYLQAFAGSTSTEAADFDYSEQQHFEAFLSVIEEHKPDVVIAWGNHVWNALPDEWRYGDAKQDAQSYESGEIIERCYVYPFKNDQQITLLGVTHPSGGYSWEPHHDKFQALGIYK